MEKRHAEEERKTGSSLGRDDRDIFPMDPIQLDLFVIDPESEEKFRRPWLPMVFDTHTRTLARCDFHLEKSHTPYELNERLFDDCSERGDAQ